jgi:hypothetical protein
MANELRGVSAKNLNLYAHITNSAGKRWNGSQFETYASGNYSTYGISLTEQGTSGVYFADFPSDITTSGSYEYFVYRRIGGSQAEGDPVVGTGSISWNGTISASEVLSGAMSGSDFLTYVKRIFKRTDKDTELYEHITDAIAELRRIYSFDEDKVEMTTTDTISVDGDFKLSVESDHGLFLGDVVVVDDDASQVLLKVSKESYDRLYPNPSATNVTTGKPRHYAIFSGEIYLGPVPDDTGYTYRLSYSISGSTITSATVSVPFTKHYREALRAGVLAKAFDGVENDAQAAKYVSMWEYFKNQIQLREEMNQKGTGFVEYTGI